LYVTITDKYSEKYDGGGAARHDDDEKSEFIPKEIKK